MERLVHILCRDKYNFSFEDKRLLRMNMKKCQGGTSKFMIKMTKNKYVKYTFHSIMNCS